MQPATEAKIVLIVRPSRVDDLIRRFNTEAQAKFYVESRGGDFSDYRREHEIYYQARTQACRQLSTIGRLQILDRQFLPNYVFGPQDLVVALGQDGLVANVIKYLDGQAVVGVNPDPDRYEGTLLPFTVNRLGDIIQKALRHDRPTAKITMAQVRLNSGETLYAVNDLFIGPKSHTSIRYRIETGGRAENHSSSGVIVSTGLGSTGWLRSVLTGAAGITRGAVEAAFSDAKLQQELPLAKMLRMDWDAQYLLFSVREPWPSKGTAAAITFGSITAKQPLVLHSQMAENAVIFSDGIEPDFLEFNAGSIATIGIADKHGCLVK